MWQAYIDFEIAEGELERTRALYERLLDRTKHYKVWVSFAKFEASSAEQEEDEEEEPQEEIDATERKKECIRRARGKKTTCCCYMSFDDSLRNNLTVFFLLLLRDFRESQQLLQRLCTRVERRKSYTLRGLA